MYSYLVQSCLLQENNFVTNQLYDNYTGKQQRLSLTVKLLSSSTGRFKGNEIIWALAEEDRVQKALHMIWFCTLDIHINRKQLILSKEKFREKAAKEYRAKHEQ